MPPRPQSAEMKILQGNPGKRRVDLETDVRFELGAPDPPKEVTGEARRHWKYLVGILAPARVLSAADLGVMILVCNCYAEMMRFERICARYSSPTYKVKGSTGQSVTKKREEFAMLATVRRQYLRMLIELGMTPASRTRVKALPRAKPTGLSAYLDK